MMNTDELNGGRVMKKFKIYSSETVLYETIVEAESEDEA